MKRRGIGDMYNPKRVGEYNKLYGESLENGSESDQFFFSLIPANLSGKIALDLGAGNGRYSELLHDRGAEHILALDLSKSMLLKIKERKDEKKLDNISMVQGDIKNLPIGESKIDYIVSRFGIMYTDDLNGLMRRLSEVMTDDGEILIETNFVTTQDGGLKEKIQGDPLPITLKIGANSVDIENHAYFLEDYLKAFNDAGLTIETTQQFPAEELSVNPNYKHSDSISLQYIVFRLRKNK